MSSASGGPAVNTNGKGVSVTNNGEQLLTVTLVKDETGYGMKISGDNPVYIQSVRGGGCAWRAGLRAGDRIHTVNARPARHSTHAQVVDMIKSGGARVVLTVVQNQRSAQTPPVSQHHSQTTITAPVPVDREKQKQLQFTKIQTIRLMWENEQKHLEKLRSEDLRDDDRRKELAAVEERCNILRNQYEIIASSLGVTLSGFGSVTSHSFGNKKSGRLEKDKEKDAVSFLSGLPRSLSNLTSQSLRNLRQNKTKPEDDKRPPSLVGPCLPPQSPPPPQAHGDLPTTEYYEGMPNSISMQLSYPLIASQSTLQTAGNPPLHHSMSQLSSNNNSVDHGDGTEDSGWELVVPTALSPTSGGLTPPNLPPAPPGTPPPPYIHSNSQSRVDTQRSIISMEEDDVPSTRWSVGASVGAGLGGACFGPASAAVLSRSRCAVLLNLSLSERRQPQASALLFTCLADLYAVQACTAHTRARWAYEIHSAFLVPTAPLQLKCVDEQTAREIDDILTSEGDNEDALRKVFVKARTKAVDDLQHLVTDFQVKKSVGLGSLYGPSDAVLDRCDTDKSQESVVVQRAVVSAAGGVRAHALSAASSTAGLLTAAFLTVAHMHLGVRLSVLWNAVCGEGGVCAGLDADPDLSGSRSNPTPPLFLEADRRYKRRYKKIAKQARSMAQKCVPVHAGVPLAVLCTTYCHHCHLLIHGHAPQAYLCQDCDLTVHADCWRSVEEGCCGPTHAHANAHSHAHADVRSHSDPNNRISRLMDKIHGHHNSQDNVTSTPLEKKSRKSSSTINFIQSERSTRRQEEEPLLSADCLAGDSSVLSASTNHSYQERAEEDRSHDDSASVSTASTSASTAHDSQGKVKAARPVARASSSASCPARGAQRTQHAPQHKQPRNTSDPSRMISRTDVGDTSSQQLAASNASSNSSLEQQKDNVELHHGSDSSDWSDEGMVEGNWSEGVPAHVASQLNSKQRKAQELIHELIQSEKSHSRWLKVLKRVFLRPLEKSTLLPQDEVRALFPNLPSIEQHHNTLMSKLTSLRRPDSELEDERYIVKIEPVADVIYTVLSSPSYSLAVSEFCRCQGMALKSLKERRRKHKELHAFLLAKEKHPACERLQLPAILATVWQRLTKYKLLLENMMCTLDEEAETDAVERLRLAVDTAKDVLQTVDDAVKKTENQHRLRSIQAKLEIRTEGGDSQLGLLPQAEELRRLDLASHNLILEGELNIRQEASKKANLLALFLEDCLVLLHRDGERFVLKPLHQPSHAALLSPIVEWSTVLFRPNATVKNGFFLANINGVQMYELSANTSSEYNTWAKHISRAPLAYKHGVPMPMSSSSAAANTSVSRNPSDASNASNTSTSHSNESQTEDQPTEAKNDEDKRSESEERKQDNDSCSTIPVTSNGRIVIHSDREDSPYELYAVPQDVIVTPQPEHHVAATHLTHQERLRRVDEMLSRCLSQKASLVAEALGVPEDACSSVAELAVQDLRAHNAHVRSAKETDSSEHEGKPGTEEEEPQDPSSQSPHTVHQLLLVAQTQVNQLTRILWPAGANSARWSRDRDQISGLCDQCTIARSRSQTSPDATEGNAESAVASEAVSKLDNLVQNGSESAIELVMDVQSSLSHLIDILPTLERERNTLRQQLRAANERISSMAYIHKDCVIVNSGDPANTSAD